MSNKRISLKFERLQEHCDYLEHMIENKQIDMVYEQAVTFLYSTVNFYLANYSMNLEIYLDRFNSKKLAMCCYVLNEAIVNNCFDNETTIVLKELIEFASENEGLVMFAKITLHELAKRIIDDYEYKYHYRIHPLDYYISWYTDVLVIVDDKQGKLIFNYKKYLQKWKVVLGDDREEIL